MPNNLHGMRLTGKDGSIDLEKKAAAVGKASFFDQDDCMWLSSDCLLRSSHLSLDEWFNSWLLISESSHLFGGRGIIYFDGSSINPIEEASLALEKTTIPDAEKILSDDLNQEEVFSWLLSSTGNDAVDSSVTCIGTPESSSRMWKLDLDRNNFWGSFLNLDEKNSKWISDTESELDSLQSDFPSPSFMGSWGSEDLSSCSSFSSFTELRRENLKYDASSQHNAELGNPSSDDPLFWPFESKFDWSSSDCFSMSPRKDMGKVGSPVGISPKFIGKVSRTPKTLEHQHESDNKCVKSMTARLRKSSKGFMKIVPFDKKDGIIEAASENVPKERLVCTNQNYLEGDFASNEELQIESLMGLGEFDGHEGVELDFNKDDFFLNE